MRLQPSQIGLLVSTATRSVGKSRNQGDSVSRGGCISSTGMGWVHRLTKADDPETLT